VIWDDPQAAPSSAVTARIRGSRRAPHPGAGFARWAAQVQIGGQGQQDASRSSVSTERRRRSCAPCKRPTGQKPGRDGRTASARPPRSAGAARKARSARSAPAPEPPHRASASERGVEPDGQAGDRARMRADPERRPGVDRLTGPQPRRRRGTFVRAETGAWGPSWRYDDNDRDLRGCVLLRDGAVAAPTALVRPIGITPGSAEARAEVRGVYGGFGVAVGGLLIWAATTSDTAARQAVLMAGCLAYGLRCRSKSRTSAAGRADGRVAATCTAGQAHRWPWLFAAAPHLDERV